MMSCTWRNEASKCVSGVDDVAGDGRESLGFRVQGVSGVDDVAGDGREAVPWGAGW